MRGCNTKTSRELAFIDAELDKLRFTSLDQNPKGIRDLSACMVRKVEALENKLAENERFIEDAMEVHGNLDLDVQFVRDCKKETNND